MAAPFPVQSVAHHPDGIPGGLYQFRLCRDPLRLITGQRLTRGGVCALGGIQEGYAFRTPRQSPLFAAVAVGSLALGIGANTAIFTLIDAILLRALPVQNPH